MYPEHFKKFLDKTEYIYRHPSDRFFLIYLSLYSKIEELYNVTVRDLKLKLSGNYQDFPIYKIKDVRNITFRDFPYPSSLVIRGKSSVNIFPPSSAQLVLAVRNVVNKLGIRDFDIDVYLRSEHKIPELYLKLTSIPGVAICGGSINSIISDTHKYLDTDIFIYGEIDFDKSIYEILKIFFFIGTL